jgi:hypothetical protein
MHVLTICRIQFRPVCLKKPKSHVNKLRKNDQNIGNNEKNNLAIYLKKKLNMDNLQIHVGADLLKEDADEYYKTIEIVGEGFKSLISK